MVITIYVDRTFTFITETPPVAVLIERAVKLAKGSGEPNKNRAGRITEEEVEEVDKIKMRNLNCFSLKIGGHACFALKKKEFPRPARSVPDF